MTVVAVVLIVAAIWLVRVYMYPYRACPRCGGTTRKPGSRPTSWGLCGKCGGTGNTLRPAARWLGIGED